jgi:hypothetical protein
MKLGCRAKEASPLLRIFYVELMSRTPEYWNQFSTLDIEIANRTMFKAQRYPPTKAKNSRFRSAVQIFKQ